MNIGKWTTLIAVATVIMVCTSPLGCSKKFEAASFQDVKHGMTYEEVVAILGKPADWQAASMMAAGDTSVTIHDWVNESNVFVVTFMSNQVQAIITTAKADYEE